MAVNLVSPGVKIREIDLTLGRIDPANDQIAGFAGPFQKGPVGVPVLIQNEQELLRIFGAPSKKNNQNSYWLAASNYLSYGGVMRVVRADSSTSTAMGNAYASVGVGSTGSVKIKSVQDYINIGSNELDAPKLENFIFAAKNPGTWGNNITVYMIDSAADQIVSGINTANVVTGYGVSISIVDEDYSGASGVSTFNGYLKGIITGVGNSSVNVKLLSRHGETGSQFISYSPRKRLASIRDGYTINIVNPSTSNAIATYTTYSVADWYDQQTVQLGNSTVYWKNIAERPSTSEYTESNQGANDEINIIVVDNEGKLTGNVGEILEKFEKLSKAPDGKVSSSQSIYYRDYIRDNSNYIFVGAGLTGERSRFSGMNNYSQYSEGSWSNEASNTYYDVVGNKTYKLNYGTDYDTTGNTFYKVNIGDIISAYSVFENPAEYSINYLINGPSSDNIFESQAKANYLISLAESRRDCIAVISPHFDVVNEASSANQTESIIEFFSGVTGSTFAVFDSGYKYTFDRFNNEFLYLACNSDIAGLMARTSINLFPWYSPAGASRGVLNNAIKLAYNPSEAQRDELYTNRINPVIASPGQGIILYGDKTASSYVSAFDRINVRKLFLTLERTIERAARSQIFEFNDAITRSNFVNTIDPYLRDVKTKRGITDYLLVCDESNNTPDIIDSNQFKADIYIKPARSINFITLTFVATKTGVSFSEIVGNI